VEQAMPNKHDIVATFMGQVYTLYFVLEGREIALAFDGMSTWTRTLTGFVVDGPLDALVVAHGVDGTNCGVQFSVDGRPLTDAHQPMSGVISKGVWSYKASLPLA
jgi:hypothetical protein